MRRKEGMINMFDYPAIMNKLLVPEIVRDLSAIHEYRGR